MIEISTPPTPLKVKLGSFTRDISLADGNQAITGIGFSPKVLLFFAAVDSTTLGTWGFDDLISGQLGMGEKTTGVYTIHTGWSIICWSGATDLELAKLLSLDADGFTLSWVKSSGTPTGTLTIKYLALG